jgi:hypothetical protein
MSSDLIITGITAVEIEKFTTTDHQQPAGNKHTPQRKVKLPLLKTIISFIPQDLQFKKGNEKTDMCSKEQPEKMFLQNIHF